MPLSPPPAEPPRHLLVPFASASADGCRQRLAQLRLPQLEALLALLVPESVAAAAREADAHSLSTPHEQALAEALGLAPADRADGRIPWAALHGDTPSVPQAWFSPCHFQIGMDQVLLLPPEQLALGETDSRPLCDALAPFCAEDGITLRYQSPARWLASGEPLRGLACASLDRVAGRSVSDWMPERPTDPASDRLLKRLQSEAQMLFYAHPAHDQRSASGRLPVNGFWVSGAGALSAAVAGGVPTASVAAGGAAAGLVAAEGAVPGRVAADGTVPGRVAADGAIPGRGAADGPAAGASRPGGAAGTPATAAQPATVWPQQPDALRQAALRGDWEAWHAGWTALDKGDIAQWLQAARQGAAVRLTLCGERRCRHWRSGPPGPLARLGRLLQQLGGREPVARLLEGL